MKQSLLAFLLLLGGLAGVPSASAQVKAPEGFTPLFNGKDLAGWHGMGTADPRPVWALSEDERTKKWQAGLEDLRKHWTVEGDELVNDGHGEYATTDKDYGDIELLIDYKTVAKADSGIYLRATPQVQIWDYTKEGGKWNLGADKGSGGLWNNAGGTPGKDPLVLADKPFGEWNRFRIVQIGARTSIWLNDKLVVDHAFLENFWTRGEKPLKPEDDKHGRNGNKAKPLFAKGPIQLQTHGGEIRWRNVFVREIGAEEANKWLAAKNAEGFASVFNGQDFTGWSGPVSNYQVKDGAICCKPGQGGTIHTQEEYADFVARVEFKVPPGGNNGLAIRYPGQGDTAYVGMCELQVLDSESPKYKSLDPRQYHGSAYGMAPAHRGYLRPAGEWNFQEVTVKGSTIKVELNGSVILDTDLSQITEYMAKSPHPGKERASGHFGFAGHGDAVEFRNVSIKKL